jgi:CRP-like cAMP-binding protein
LALTRPLTPATLLAPVALLVALALLEGALALGPAGGPAMLVATRVVDSALWLAGIWLAMRLIELLIWDRLLPHWLGLRAPRLLRQFVAVMLLVLGVAVLLGHTWGLALSAVLATTGVLGIVLGLALRNILADFFSGIALNIEKPFDLGDFVLLRAPGQRTPFIGTVQEVNWRSTGLLTPEDNLVSVPNSVVAAAIVENLSHPSPVSEQEIDLTLAWDVPQALAERVLQAACTEAWAQGATGGDKAPKVRMARMDGGGVTWRVVYLLDPRLRGKGSAVHLLLSCVHRHLRLAGLQPAALPGVVGTPAPSSALAAGTPAVAGATAAAPTAAPATATATALHLLDHQRPSDRQAVMAEVALMQPVSPTERARLAQVLRVHRLEPGTMAVRLGDPGDSMFVVAAGVMEVRTGADDNQARANVLGAGSVFGEMALLTGEPRSATVRALCPAVLYELSRPMLAPLLSERPGLADELALAMEQNRQRDLRRLGAAAQAGEPASAAGGLVRQLAARIRAWLQDF